MPKRPFLGLALCVSLALPAAARAIDPGDYDRTLVFDGVERTYQFRVPAGYDGSEPIPLVLDIHGLGSNGAQQKLISKMAAEADAAGFAAVWPDGTDNSWNAGDCCGMAVANQVDDVGFLRTLVDAMRTELSIRADRIYVTGLSNGGAMTQVLACRAADLFAAAAPMSFPIPYHPLSTCAPSRAIPVLTFQGLSDNLVPYAGNGFVAPAADSFAQWLTNDGCGTDPSEEIDDFGMSSCEIDTSCADGAQAGLCSIASTVEIVGTVGHVIYFNDDHLELSDVAWEFFSRFTLPGDPAPLALPLAGKKLVVEDGTDASKRKLDASLRDAKLVPSAALDPVANGATLQLYNTAGSGESVCMPLPASGWRKKGNAFAYKDKTGANGPCQSVKLAAGKLEAKCSGKKHALDYTLDEPAQGMLTLRFASGGLALCSAFGGTISADTGSASGKAQFQAKSSEAPVVCQEPRVSCGLPE